MGSQAPGEGLVLEICQGLTTHACQPDCHGPGVLQTIHPQPSPGKPVQGLVSFQIPDTILDHNEILVAAKSLHNGQVPGASGMTVEDIMYWALDADTTPIPWQLTIQLIQHAFAIGIIPTRARSNTLVFILKPELGQMHGIGLLEPVWKLISAMVNCCLMQSIQFHNDLHGFLPSCGMGMASLKAKLEAQIAFRSSCFLHHIYHDFDKDDDSLDCNQKLMILAKYGVGPNMLCLLHSFSSTPSSLVTPSSPDSKPTIAPSSMLAAAWPLVTSQCW